LKEFLFSLTKGIKYKDILKTDNELLDRLVRAKIVKQTNGIYKCDSKYRFGVLDVSRTGTGYLDIINIKKHKDLLIESHDLNGGTRGDIVVVKRSFSKGGRAKARVVEILKKEFAVSVVYLKEVDGQVIGLNIKNDLPTVIGSTQKALQALPSQTVLKIDNTTNMIVEILGVLDDPKVDEKISLSLYNKIEFFSSKALLEAKSYGDKVDKSMYLDRIDLTGLNFCTIDPPTAKDFDDAVYFDVAESTLYVAIADVSEYVSSLSNIDQEAIRRGFSIYFPHKSIPMLPRELSENICSLKPEVDRLAYVYKMKICKDSLEVVESLRFEAVINSKRRYTYDRIDEFLDDKFENIDEIDEKILEYLLPMKELLFRVRGKRLLSGCEFRSDDISMKLDENQALISTKIETQTPSHALIEDAMLLANKEAAKAMKKGIFRVHEKPSLAKLDDMLDTLATIGIYSDVDSEIYPMIRSLQKRADEKDLRTDVDKLIIRAQQQAQYSVDNKGHFGLGFDTYTHFTSPIRRYSDLVVHRLLKAYSSHDKRQLEFLLGSLEVTAMKISELERESAKVAWDFMDRKYARWAKENIGTKIEAVITDTDRTSICMTTQSEIYGMRIFLVVDDDAQIFEKVEVEITEAYITSGKVMGVVSGRLEEIK